MSTMKYFCSVLATSAGVLIQAASAQTTLTLDNGTVRVRQDLTRGGAIAYISKSVVDRNIVNIADEGRYVQQSYYAGSNLNRQAEGQSPSWSPWPWNPIQVGDYARNRAQILDYANTSSSTYVKCIPMLWDMNNRPAEAEMEQWTELQGNVVKVRNRITCHRTDTIYGEGLSRHQELPAVYPISALDQLYSYFGNAPFSNAPVTNTAVVNLSSGFWGVYQNNMVAESWMAFVDGTGWGLGVYSPITKDFLAGRAGSPGGEATSGSTGYIAPIKAEAFYKNTVYEYEYALIVGTVSEIRSAVYALAGVGAGPEQSGVWTNTASGNWSASNNWSEALIANGTGHTGDFSTIDITADVTVHLDSSRTIGALVFGDEDTSSAGNWIIDNSGTALNTLTLDGASTIAVNALGADQSATISTRLAGTNGLAKLGPGTLKLSGTNSFSGATTVSGGVLEIAGAGQLGGGTYSDAITNNATVMVNSTAAQTLSGVISGTGDFVKANTGAVTLCGRNTYGGATTINGGTLKLGFAEAMSPVTIPNYGFEAPVISGYQYTPSGASWTFAGGSGIDHNSGTWYPTATGHEGVQAAFIADAWTFSQSITVSTAGTYAISFQAEGRGGALGPNGVIVKVDGIAVGTWPASAISQSQWQNYLTYADLAAGPHTLTFAGNNTLGGDKSVAIDNVQMSQLAAGMLPPSTAVQLAAAGATLDLSGTTQTIGSLTAVAGSIVTNGTLIVGGNNGTTTFAGLLSGPGGLTKTGTSTLTFSGANTYSGPTVIRAGTLGVMTGGSCANSAISVAPTTGSATLGISVRDNSNQWTCASLATDGAGTPTLTFEFGPTPLSPTIPPLHVSGAMAFTVTPAVTINVSVAPTAGRFPLLHCASYTGTVPTTATLTGAMSGAASLTLEADPGGGHTLYATFTEGNPPVLMVAAEAAVNQNKVGVIKTKSDGSPVFSITGGESAGLFSIANVANTGVLSFLTAPTDLGSKYYVEVAVTDPRGSAKVLIEVTVVVGRTNGTILMIE